MNKLRYALLTTSLFFCFGMSVNAQVPRPTPVPTICTAFEQAAEEAADLAKRTAIERDGYKVQLDIANQKLAVKDEEVANAREQRDFYKAAYEKGTKIDNNSALVIENLRFQVNDYKNEVNDLRRENDKLRSSRDIRTMLGFGAGFGLGYYVHK